MEHQQTPSDAAAMPNSSSIDAAAPGAAVEGEPLQPGDDAPAVERAVEAEQAAVPDADAPPGSDATPNQDDDDAGGSSFSNAEGADEANGAAAEEPDAAGGGGAEEEDAASADAEAAGPVDDDGPSELPSGGDAAPATAPAGSLSLPLHAAAAAAVCSPEHGAGPEPAVSSAPPSDDAASGSATQRSQVSTGSALESECQLGVSAQASSSGLASSLNSRPMSAAAAQHAALQLRGSRPCSAAIAAQIEGFEADFQDAAEAARMMMGVLGDVPEAEPQAGAPEAAPTPAELLARAQREAAALAHVNEGLQQRARQVLEQASKGRPPVMRDLGRLEGAEARYQAALTTWGDLRRQREVLDNHFQTTTSSMKAALEGRLLRAQEVADTLGRFKHDVAAAAEDAKTGRGLPRKLLAELQAKEHELDEQVQRVRLKNIHLAGGLKKLEATIRSKEQLAVGLHLIDFEQLRIENQSLIDKIEERNDELVRLRRKTTSTVQILTHMKAKLVFVERENEELDGRLQELEAALAGRRDELVALKARRDRLRQQGRQLKEGSVFVTDPLLLQDMQAQLERRDDLLAEVELLRERYAALAPPTAAGSPSTGNGRAGSPAAGRLPAAAASGRSGKRRLAAKSPPVGLQVRSTTCCTR